MAMQYQETEQAGLTSRKHAQQPPAYSYALATLRLLIQYHAGAASFNHIIGSGTNIIIVKICAHTLCVQ